VNIAYLGMGIMGSAMAANCLKHGHRVAVYNRTASKCAPLAEQGAEVAPTPAAAAAGKEAVLMCVDDAPAVEQVLFGDDGAVHGLTQHADPPVLVIDHSTISAKSTDRIARRLSEEAGAVMVDAPVSGGDVGARAGALSIMCGGPAEAFERARPLFEAMGKTIVHVGERHGDGQRAKMINQMVVALNCVATTEAMRFGEAMGVDMRKVMEAISQGAAGSWSLSNLGPRLLARDFAPGFRLRHLLKDVGFCEEVIQELPPPQNEAFPGTEMVMNLIKRSVVAGNGEHNIHAMSKVFLDDSD